MLLQKSCVTFLLSGASNPQKHIDLFIKDEPNSSWIKRKTAHSRADTKNNKFKSQHQNQHIPKRHFGFFFSKYSHDPLAAESSVTAFTTHSLDVLPPAEIMAFQNFLNVLNTTVRSLWVHMWVASWKNEIYLSVVERYELAKRTIKHFLKVVNYVFLPADTKRWASDCDFCFASYWRVATYT